MGDHHLPRVFISYSHRDQIWMDRFQTRLNPLYQEHELLIWNDSQILPGESWMESIDHSMNCSSLALLLVSPHFLVSPFIRNKELPNLLESVREKSLSIFWVLLSPCFYEVTPLVKYQAAHDISKPLESLSIAKRNEAIMDICRSIRTRIYKTAL